MNFKTCLKKKHIGFQLDERKVQKMDRICSRLGITRSELCRRIVAGYLGKKAGQYAKITF